jgi:pimeloyl-ACP methyl ester carboxylesterase
MRAYPRELRALAELRSTRNPAGYPAPPGGDGRTVLLVTGFLAPERTLGRLARWLHSGGWQPLRAGIGWNTDCSQVLVDRLAARLEEATTATGQRATVIGHSRGGMLGRALAVQRPDLVDTVIAMGSPVSDPRSFKPQLRFMIAAAAGLGTLGVPGLLTRSCLHGACCDRFWAGLGEAPNPDVRLVSIWSPLDGVLDPAACPDPHAESRRVRSSHRGMAVNLAVWNELASVLTEVNTPIS